MSSFPDEVMMQILARLPIKPLFKTKTVCKPWYTLASDKYFVTLYNELCSKNPTVLFEIQDSILQKSSLIWVDNLRGVSELSLDFLQDSVKIRSSCNGLLCCSSNSVKGVYYVCNPITRDFKVLPKCKEWSVTRFYPDGEAILVGLACDSSRNNKFNVALAGYHRTSESDHRSDWTFVCLTYGSDSNKWRKIVSSEVDSFTHMNKNQVVFVNGALHWLNGSCSYILVLDLENENWRKISLPNEVSGKRAYLVESSGCLSLIKISDAWMKIWVMKDYERQVWHMVDEVSLRCIKGIFPITEDGECVFLASNKQVLMYNRNSRVWKEIYSVKNGAKLPLWFSAYAFRSTILPC